MANRTTGRSTGRKNTKRSSAGRSSAKTRSKSSARNNSTNKGGLRDEVALVLSFGASVLLFLCHFGIIGPIGNGISGVLFGLMGILAYVLPVLIFLYAAFRIANKGLSMIPVLKFASFIAIIFCIGIIGDMISGLSLKLESYSITDIYEHCSEGRCGGGIIFGSIAYLLNSLIGKIGLILLLIVLFVLAAIFISEKSLVNLVSSGSQRAYDAAARGTERYREYREDRKVIIEQQRLEREEERRLREERREQERIRREERRQEQQLLREAEEARLNEEWENKNREMERLREEEAYMQEVEEQNRILKMDKKPAPIPDNTTAGSSLINNLPIKKPGIFTKTPSIEYMDDEGEEIREIVMEKSGVRNISEPAMTRPEIGHERIMPEPEKEVRKISSIEAPEPEFSEPSFEDDFSGYTFDSDFKPRDFTDRGQKNTSTLNRANILPDDGYDELDPVDDFRKEYEPVKNHEPVKEYEPINEYEPVNEYEPIRETFDSFKLEKDIVEEETEPVREIFDSFKPEKDIIEEGTESVREIFDSFKPEKDPYADPKPSAGINEVPFGDPEISVQTYSSSKDDVDRDAQTSTRSQGVVKTYTLPGTQMLSPWEEESSGDTEESLRTTAQNLVDALASFKVKAEVDNISQGPAVTRYELKPAVGVKVNSIVSLQDDIMLALSAASIRIEAPIPGKSAVGIEVPNNTIKAVHLRELLENKNFTQEFKSGELAFAVGKDIGGNVIVADIAKMPHLLIAGSTGSGKSVCINTLIMSILYKSSPEEVKMILIDPKVVELSVYNGIPHLMVPVVTDPKQAASALHWGVAEMTQRYKKFSDLGVRNLEGYNKKVGNDVFESADGKLEHKKLPKIVIVVDEMADLMMVAAKEVEESICRLAQLARAAGIHLILATQRPSVDVITGLIKANMPSRIAFAVSSSIDSRTILDMGGAEKLLGKGDMLFAPQGSGKPSRVQGAFVSDSEVEDVVNFWKQQADPSDMQVKDIAKELQSMTESDGGGIGAGGEELDEYFERAGRFIIEKQKASIGLLQRAFKIGFNRAARIMDQLYDAGVVSEDEGTKPRKVIMTMEDFEDYLNG